MGDQLQIGVIGAGRIGYLHAGHIATRVPGASLAAVSDIVESAAEGCAAEFGVRSIHKDYREILDRSDVDAVVICSSTDTHSRIITEAAQAGKHIFCEKPIDFDLARIDASLAAVEDSGVTLQIGFNRRFDPSFARVKDLIRSGSVGDLHLLRITSRDPAPPPLAYVKVSGGLFLDMMIHDFDMARFLAGCEVTEVFAIGAVLVDPAIGEAGDIDTALVSLTFESGAIGAIDNSRQAVYGYDQRVEAFGSAGMAAAGNEYPNATVLSTAERVERDLPLNFFIERYTDSYIAEMKEFVACVTANRPPPVSGADGRAPVVLGMAARRSLEEHRPVKLSELDESAASGQGG